MWSAQGRRCTCSGTTICLKFHLRRHNKVSEACFTWLRSLHRD
jgi:hypothetical protein